MFFLGGLRCNHQNHSNHVNHQNESILVFFLIIWSRNTVAQNFSSFDPPEILWVEPSKTRIWTNNHIHKKKATLETHYSLAKQAQFWLLCIRTWKTKQKETQTTGFYPHSKNWLNTKTSGFSHQKLPKTFLFLQKKLPKTFFFFKKNFQKPFFFKKHLFFVAEAPRSLPVLSA